MKDIIKLESRYRGDNNYLERIGESTSKRYLLKTEGYYRLGFEDSNPDTYTFVDPAGGPFIQNGTVLDGYSVKSISDGDNGIIIEFE